MPTKIEWATDTWNPITGCTKISEACQNCYAERMSKRLAGRCGYPKDAPFEVTLHPDKLDEPLKWKKPRMIFVCSMGDLFHEDVPYIEIAKVFGRMHSTNQHTYLVLTKRPERMKAFFDWFAGPEWRGAWPQEYSHVWLGVTAENQQRADERIPILLQIPAAVRFVSIEPMLGPIDLTNITMPDKYQPPHVVLPSLNGFHVNALRDDDDHMYQSNNHLDWVICGGETGPGARPMHPDWVRSLLAQCQEAGTPFFFKSWGDWAPGTWMADSESDMTITVNNDLYYDLEKMFDSYSEDKRDNWAQKNFYTLSSTGIWCDPLTCYRGECMVRVGKKKAGRLLDGQEWSQYPEVREDCF